MKPPPHPPHPPHMGKGNRLPEIATSVSGNSPETNPENSAETNRATLTDAVGQAAAGIPGLRGVALDEWLDSMIASGSACSLEGGCSIDPPPLCERKLTLVNKRGLHARAASAFSRTAGGFQAEVWVFNGEAFASGTSIMGLLTLGAGVGDTIRVTAAGADATALLDALEGLVSSGFGEAS